MNLPMDDDLFSLPTHTEQIRSNAAYERLPESVKLVYTESEWLWLSGPEKRDLELRETEPETE
jgi:hypothetical protein